MFASVTDYASVYDDAYRARRGTHTSFEKSVLPNLLASFCKSHAISRILDVSGGQGHLGDAVRSLGIDSITTDFGSTSKSGVLDFDLAGRDSRQLEHVLRAVHAGQGDYLSTCFDVLEHIDREHVASAILNLAELTSRLLVISVSTRPSSRDNLMHATLAPTTAWLAAFEAAGFSVQPDSSFGSGTTVRTFPDLDELRLVNRWLQTDVFGDARFGEPRYFTLAKNAQHRSESEIRTAIELIFDVTYRHAKRTQFSLPPDATINFNLHHVQEWSLLRPLLDVVPRAQARFFIRPEVIADDHLRAMRGFLQRNGVPVIEYAGVGDLPWSDFRDQVVVSGAESTVGGSHLAAFEFVSLARLNGCRTFLFQHGIWPRAFQNRIVGFASEHVLVWGGDDEERLNHRRHEILGIPAPWGCLPDEQAVRLGAPKFSDHLIGPFPGLDKRLGFPPERFDRVILFGTKSMAGVLQSSFQDDHFFRETRALIDTNPRTLFIIRPHPRTEIEALNALKAENVIIFDELTAILADLSLARVMHGVDVVVTSPSSLIVDAAVSDKPTVVYQTGQPVEYEGLAPEPLPEVMRILEDPAALARKVVQTRQFRMRYAGAVDDRSYAKFAQLLATTEAKRGQSKPGVDRLLATSVSVASEAVAYRHLYQALSVTNNTAQAENGRVSAELLGVEQRNARLQDEIVSLETERQQALLQYQQEFTKRSRMASNPTWRMTAPLRALAKYVARAYERLPGTRGDIR